MIGIAVAEAFCGRSNGRWRSGTARFDMCAGSLNIRSEQFGQAYEAVGGHREGELPIDLEHPVMPHLTQAGHCLGPAEGSRHPGYALSQRIRKRVEKVRPSIAERRPLVFCATCGVTVLSRSAVTKLALS
jgi:hypothetical protein